MSTPYQAGYTYGKSKEATPEVRDLVHRYLGNDLPVFGCGVDFTSALELDSLLNYAKSEHKQNPLFVLGFCEAVLNRPPSRVI